LHDFTSVFLLKLRKYNSEGLTMKIYKEEGIDLEKIKNGYYRNRDGF
jgi:hypothetical protein